MPLWGLVTLDTCAPVRRSSESKALGKLVRMLRSMSRRLPNTFLRSTTGVFGVWSEGNGYLQVVFNGRWTNEDLRDCLVLFATLLAVDPAKLGRAEKSQCARNGVSSTDREQ